MQEADQPLHQKHLDDIVAAGCGAPGCSHQSHGHGPLYLSSVCHPQRSRVRLRPRRGGGLCLPDFGAAAVLDVSCAACDRPIVALALAAPLTEEEVTRPCPCTPGPAAVPIQVRYTRGAGAVEVTCWHCERVLCALPLQKTKALSPFTPTRW